MLHQSDRELPCIGYQFHTTSPGSLSAGGKIIFKTPGFDLKVLVYHSSLLETRDVREKAKAKPAGFERRAGIRENLRAGPETFSEFNVT
jgi:hypothetical protein